MFFSGSIFYVDFVSCIFDQTVSFFQDLSFMLILFHALGFELQMTGDVVLIPSRGGGQFK
jgi:hypothetical protein